MNQIAPAAPEAIDTAGLADQLNKLITFTDALVMHGEHVTDIYGETVEDLHQARRGYVRTCCQWCDGEFFVPVDVPGPHSCRACGYKDGY